MGWASGSYMAEELWRDISEFVDEEHKKEAAKIIFDLFEDHDADDWNGDSELVQLADPDWLHDED